MRVSLDSWRAASEAQSLVDERLAWEPAALPGLTPGTVRRWEQTPTWQPPETTVLARHHALGRPYWVVTNSRQPLDGYELDFDLGVLQRYEQPGTRRLVGSDRNFVLTGSDEPLRDGDRVLGHVEQAPFPMLDRLDLHRFPATGQLLPVGGKDDPMRAVTEPVRALGYAESFPIQPRRLIERRPPPWNLIRLIRRTDRAIWRHRYAVAAWEEQDTGPESLSLGSLWTHPGPGLVRLWLEADGRLASDLPVSASRAPGRPARTVARWVAAPLAWTPQPGAWAMRATASRARRVAQRGPGPGSQGRPPITLGYLRAAPATGCGRLYSAGHPALQDQFVTRSKIEATDLGYRVEGTLGWIANLGAERHRGPAVILWGSRFGQHRRYVES